MQVLRALLGCLLVGTGSVPAVTNWPQFRGPDGDGVARQSQPPLRWSESENIRWKTPIHGRGWASPVIWGEQIFIATATEDGSELSLVTVHKDTGAVLRDQKLFEVADPQFCHKFNSYASPTPVAEEGRLYVTFGSPGTACIDTASGKVLWERRDFVCNHFRGAGSSPIVWEDLLILNFDGSDAQYVAALDKNTGRTRWQVKRSIDFKDLDSHGKPAAEGDFRKAFSTPHVAMIEGVPTLLSQGAKAVYAYEPATGTEIWRVEERENHSASTRPLFAHGLVFAPTGFIPGQLLAIRPGRKGEVIDANATSASETTLKVVWKAKRGVPKKPSLIIHGELLFGVEDGGVATCWNAKTGEVLWNERLGGDHSASPLLAADRVYFFNEQGRSVVVAASREFQKLAENTLEDGFMASPAVTGNALILRTKTHLYRIEE